MIVTDPAIALVHEREALYDVHVPVGQWIVLRIDGHHFSSLTEHSYYKPFDERFHTHMIATAQRLLIDLSALYVYTGSDEITVVLDPTFDQWNRRVQKLISLSAAMATDEFVHQSGQRAHFDCRVMGFEQLSDVVTCCNMRRSDVERNALYTACYWTLRHNRVSPFQAEKRLRNTSWQEKKLILHQLGIRYNALPSWQRKGVNLVWQKYTKTGFNPIQQTEVVADRRCSTVTDIPDEYYAWLTEYLTQSSLSS